MHTDEVWFGYMNASGKLVSDITKVDELTCWIEKLLHSGRQFQFVELFSINPKVYSTFIQKYTMFPW